MNLLTSTDLKDCMVCGRLDPCKFVIVISPAYPRLEVCPECMNDYGSGNFKELTKKLDERTRCREQYKRHGDKRRKTRNEKYKKDRKRVLSKMKEAALRKRKQRTQEEASRR